MQEYLNKNASLKDSIKFILRPAYAKKVGLRVVPLDRPLKYVPSLLNTTPKTKDILKLFKTNKIPATRAEGMLSVRQRESMDTLGPMTKSLIKLTGITL